MTTSAFYISTKLYTIFYQPASYVGLNIKKDFFMFITTARAKQTQCKCCNSPQANLWDVCDFHNHCHQPHLGIQAPLTGVGIYYYRCDVCEFIFTKDFDHFGNKGFSQYIYNDDYPKLDIDYAEKTPFNNL